MNVQIEESWKQHLQGEFEKPYFAGLTENLLDDSFSMPSTCVRLIR